jgi:hypothetical protein
MLYDYNVGQLVGAMALMFMTFLVLVAAWKNRIPNLMLPWLFVQIVSIIIAISYLIYSAIMGITADDTGVVEILFACVGGGMYMSAHCAGGFRRETFNFHLVISSSVWIFIVLGFYFWLVVLSYYQELKANATTEQLPDEKATGQFPLC